MGRLASQTDFKFAFRSDVPYLISEAATIAGAKRARDKHLDNKAEGLPTDDVTFRFLEDGGGLKVAP